MYFQLAPSRTLLVLLFFFSWSTYCPAQNFEQIFKLINERKLDSASILAREASSHFPNNPEAHYAVAKINMLSGKVIEATSLYQKLLGMPTVKKYTTGWTLHDLAICYYASGQQAKSRESLNASIELKATKNVLNSARQLSMILGFDSIYRSWKRYETAHFIFHFQKEIGNMQRFVARKEEAFRKINSFFKAELPKKIDYFVWSDESNARAVLKRPLAFTELGLSLTHTSASHTVGHEITHTISYFAVPVAKSNKLISEGVCVNFDLSTRSNMDMLKEIGFKNSIEAIWNNETQVNNDIIYPLGGELVKRLIETYGPEKFLLLLKDQSYQNASRIYGTDLKKLMQGIEEELRE